MFTLSSKFFSEFRSPTETDVNRFVSWRCWLRRYSAVVNVVKAVFDRRQGRFTSVFSAYACGDIRIRDVRVYMLKRVHNNYCLNIYKITR